MPIVFDNRIGAPLLAGIVELAGIRLDAPSDELRRECQVLVDRILAAGSTAEGTSAYLSEQQRSAVRRLLKGGGFSPTGRNRPAHELLLNLAIEQQGFPHISNAVDANNLLSLEALLPISLLDAARVGTGATLRWGTDGEGYVFNQSGHSLDVKRCLVIADSTNQPVGSPVKDSMAGKVFDGCSSLVGVVYGTEELLTREDATQLTERFAALLQRECGGDIVQCRVLASN